MTSIKNSNDNQDNKYIKYLSDDKILNIIIVKDIYDILKNYLNNISIENQHYYCKSMDNIKYDIFNNNELYIFLINCINFANNIINDNINSKNILLHSNIWKIYVYDNMMWNLPFTLNDIIFIPITYIKSSYNSNSCYSFTKTIVHERIHVSQRSMIDNWHDYIKKNNYENNEWILIKKNDNLFNFIKNYNFYEIFNKIDIINPDSFYNDFMYLYKYNKDLYYGLFILDNNNPQIKWLKINNDNNNFYFEKVNYDFCNSTQILDKFPVEHPFEYYAYKLADDYTKNLL
jgi:hypothetical protein